MLRTFSLKEDFVKYPKWQLPENQGRVEALINSISGEEIAEGLISGELTAKVNGNIVEIEYAVRVLFDRHGRSIPRDLKNDFCDADSDCHFIQPKLDYDLRLARIGECLQTEPMISAAEFEDRCQKLLERLGADEQCRNVLKAVYLPICIPQTVVADYGTALGPFLLGVDRSYTHQFAERPFNNYRKNNLANQVSVISGSRHAALLGKLAEGPVVGVYFPNPMQGLSVLAQREQIGIMPLEFMLSGGFDTVTGMVAYPDVLARDGNTPGLDLSALQWRDHQSSLRFEAKDDELWFEDEGGLDHAYDNYSGGLFVPA